MSVLMRSTRLMVGSRARHDKRTVSRSNSFVARAALSRFRRPVTQGMGFVDDQQSYAGLVCSPVPGPAGLLLLVRTDPAEFIVRLPADASAKNGSIAGA